MELSWRAEPGQHGSTGRKGQVHPDLFQTLRNTIHLSLAGSGPPSLPLTYYRGSFSVLSACLICLHKLYRDEFVFQWKTIYIQHPQKG